MITYIIKHCRNYILSIQVYPLSNKAFVNGKHH